MAQDNPQVNQKLLALIQKALHASERIKPQGLLTKQLSALQQRFKQSLDTNVSEEALAQERGEIGQIKLKEDEKLVFVRLYHKEMLKLGTELEAVPNWTSALLSTIKHSERHGLAVYATEAEARRCSRAERYCYVTLIIKKQEDLSAQRRPKQDVLHQVPLLTIANLAVPKFVKLTYRQKVFPIERGVLLLPKGSDQRS